MKLSFIVFFMMLIFFETSQQIFFKLGGIHINKRLLFYISGIIMYLCYAAVWLKVIHLIPLGVALPLMGINYVAVTLSSKFIFKENMDIERWSGLFLILTGFILVWLGGGKYYG